MSHKTKQRDTNLNVKKNHKRTQKKIKRTNKTKKITKRAIKKYYQKLDHSHRSDCLHNLVSYQHPTNPKLRAIFPFIINYDEVNRTIYKNLLSDETGINVKSWLTRTSDYDSIRGKTNKDTKDIKDIKDDKPVPVNPKKSYHTHHHKVKLEKQIQKEINFKLNSAVYEVISSRTVINTFNYLFQKISSGIYVQIKDGSISSFLPFVNTNFVNNWAHLMKLPEKYKTLKDYYEDKKEEIGSSTLKYLSNKDLWRASDCLIQTGPLGSINDSYWAEIYHMIELTCQNHQIDDLEFFLNLRNYPLLKNDFTEPFNSIYGKGVPLTSYEYPSYHPILSLSTNDDYGDLPYPSPEDWKLISGKFYRNDCQNSYVSRSCQPQQLKFDNTELASNQYDENLDWDQKLPIAYFRDDSAGCGTTIKDNMRLKLAHLSQKYPKLINAKITHISRRDKYNSELQFHSFRNLDFKTVHRDVYYGRYKYIVSIPGYGIDPKLPYYLSLGVLVFKVNGQYYSWYDHLLKPYKHYIPVKKDLSDLVTLIKWANSHPETVEKIAKNAKIVYRKHFNQKTVLEYWHYLLNSLAHRRLNSKTLENEYSKYMGGLTILPHVNITPPTLNNLSDYKLGIIIPFYSQNIEYKKVRNDLTNYLLDYFRKVKGLKFKIIVVEQYNTNAKFNKGQLINIGLLVAKKHGCTHIAINNVSFLPSQKLLSYYLAFEKANEAPVQIGFSWKSKYRGHYLGIAILWNLSVLEKVGGYSNNVWGWGCSDAILYHRYLKYCQNLEKEGKIYIPILDSSGIKREEIAAKQQHLIDGQYRQLKILSDWYMESYNDLENLKKFLDKEIKRKFKKKSQSQKVSYSDNRKLRYEKYLKLLDKHQRHKEVEHYTFKLMTEDLFDLIS